MFKRNSLAILALTAAIGLPIALNGGDGLSGSIAKVCQGLAGGKAPPASTSGIQPSGGSMSPNAPSGAPGTAGWSAAPRIEGVPVFDPAEVFRFDISPAWIMGRWARVSTVSEPSGMQGFRVPLVTGPTEGDLAGSLTYYFNAKEEVQRITFLGATGNPTPLVNLLTQRFKFTAVASPSPGTYLYQIRWHNRPRSELRLRLADVVNAGVQMQRFDVDLEVNLPDVPPSRPMHGEVAGR